MTKLIQIMVVTGLSGVLLACGSNFEATYEEIATDTVESLACENFELEFWDGFKEFIVRHNSFPEAAALNQYIVSQTDVLKAKRPDLTSRQLSYLAEALSELVEFVFKESEAVSSTPQEMLMLIAAIDGGDQSTAFKQYMVEQTRYRISRIKKYVNDLALTCDKEILPEEPFDLATTPINTNLPLPLTVWGARFAMTTAYQSCQAPVSEALKQNDEALRGVAITGKHPDGVGSKRVIASLTDVQRTHPYLKNVNNYSAQCFNVKENPLIYDYGGKPYATTALNSPIDFFRDNGSGTSVLGIDCSAFVFSAYATAGLKLNSQRPLKASDSWTWGSGAYMDLSKSKLDCLKNIEVSPQQTIAAGDIVAVYGHVFIIDEVGSDPLGLQQAKNEAQCETLTSQDFDFRILQSSNSLGGVGINRFEGSEYLETSPKFKEGFEKLAKESCRARFQKKTTTPNLGIMAVVRHKGTAECKAKRVELERENCITQCRL
ncbi:MAG: hypothetical protein ACLGGX_11165 [Bdellovibrionia bacterium]